MSQDDLTALFRGARMLNTHFAITTGDLPFVNVGYAMKGEDLIVRELFKADLRAGKIGFYADLGAYASRYGSNTYLFYQYGWRGICVEPNVAVIDQYQVTRPRDTFVHAAVGAADGKGFWAEAEVHEASSRIAQTKEEFGVGFKPPVEISILSLNTLFSMFVPRDTALDYLSIDIEGLELAALRSNDWSRFKPRVIVIEENTLDITNLFASPALAYLRDLGYRVEAVTPPNVIFRAT